MTTLASLRHRAAMLERAAQQKTDPASVAELQAAAERNVADSQPACEFCPPGLGAAGCGVCRVLGGVTEAELSAAS